VRGRATSVEQSGSTEKQTSRANARHASFGASGDTTYETEQRLVRERYIDARATGHEERIDVACTRQAFRDPGDARRAADMASGMGDHPEGIAL
jgi:hypothetical protein